MVVVIEEVPEELQAGERESDFATDSDAGSDASSIFSDDDEFSPVDETLYERITALKDIIPPSTRSSLSAKYNTTKAWTWWSFQKSGSLAWIVATSALLVGLPLALAIEDETRIMQQEQEMQMQSQGQQQLLGAPQGQQQGVLPPGF